MKKIFTTIAFISFLSVSVSCGLMKGGNMKLTSSDFKHEGMIPAKFTCVGKDINPTLHIEGLPEGTISFSLIFDDPDAPMGTWVHWVVFDIPAATKTIEENSIPGKQGFNNFGQNNYGGPCPPSGTHRYFFKLYALDTMLELKEGINKRELQSAMKGHVLGEAVLMGRFKK